jgi:RNA binding exosome subunit
MSQIESNGHYNREIKTLHVELNNRLSEQVWSSRFENFNEKQIKPVIEGIQETLRQQRAWG